MSPLGWALVFVLCGCVLFAIGCQLDAMEIRYEARLRKLAERWEAARRGQAPVEEYRTQLQEEERG